MSTYMYVSLYITNTVIISVNKVVIRYSVLCAHYMSSILSVVSSNYTKFNTIAFVSGLIETLALTQDAWIQYRLDPFMNNFCSSNSSAWSKEICYAWLDKSRDDGVTRGVQLAPAMLEYFCCLFCGTYIYSVNYTLLGLAKLLITFILNGTSYNTVWTFRIFSVPVAIIILHQSDIRCYEIATDTKAPEITSVYHAKFASR